MMPMPTYESGAGVYESGEGKTEYMPGADIRMLKFPSALYSVQLLDHNGQWRTWAPINPNGLKLGRGQNSAHFPFLNSMATHHVRLSYENQRLIAEDMGSLNGVYLRLNEPHELQEGMRFRVGNQVLEFHQPEPPRVTEPARASDGEEFLSTDPEPLAYLDLIGRDGRPRLRIPILSSGVTKLGREGQPVQIVLRAEWVSGQHAQLRHEAGRFWLEDLGSRNGTFVQISGRTPLRSGDILLVGRALLRVVEQTAT